MPLFYVNPRSGRKKPAKRKPAKRKPKAKAKANPYGSFAIGHKKPKATKKSKPKAKAKAKPKAKSNPKKRKTSTMAKRKKVVRRKPAARKNPKRKTTARKRRTVKRTAAKRRNPTRKRRVVSRKRRANPKRRRRTVAASPRRRTYKRRANPTRRRRRSVRRNPAVSYNWRPGTKKKGRKRTKQYGRGLAGLVRSRKSIRYQREHGGSLPKRYLERMRMRTNPGGAMMDALKKAAMVGGAFYGTRIVASKLLPMVPGIDKLKKDHAAVAGSVGMLAVAAFATKKWARGNVNRMAIRETILLGAALNAVDAVARAFMPASVKAFMGMGYTDEDIYDSALSDYVEIEGAMGDYVEFGLEQEMGDYVEIGDEGYSTSLGAEEELGLEQELGLYSEMGAAALPSGRMSKASQIPWTGGQIGRGIGTPVGSGMLRPVRSKAMARPVPERSFVKAVPEVTQRFDKPDKLYDGIFGHSGGRGYGSLG